MMFRQLLNSHRIFKQLAKALISLRVCTGWSEPLLVAHTTLLEISCHGSNTNVLVDFIALSWYNIAFEVYLAVNLEDPNFEVGLTDAVQTSLDTRDTPTENRRAELDF